MENIIEKYSINSEILELIKENTLEKAISEYSNFKKITSEESKEIIYYVKEFLDKTKVVPSKEAIVENVVKSKKNIFGNNLIYDEKSLSIYPDWDIEPQDQLINPRLKK